MPADEVKEFGSIKVLKVGKAFVLLGAEFDDEPAKP